MLLLVVVWQLLLWLGACLRRLCLWRLVCGWLGEWPWRRQSYRRSVWLWLLLWWLAPAWVWKCGCNRCCCVVVSFWWRWVLCWCLLLVLLWLLEEP